jgi:hypothetical protein
MPREPSRQPSFAVLLGLAWLLMIAQLLAQHWAETAWTLPDTDDAMRLVEVRNFLAGKGWFDLHEPRLGLPPGYESHWSRLIDAGLAGVFLFFRLFTDTAMAERLMGVAWPLLWLIPSVVGTVAIAWRLAGREAALIVLLLAVFNLPGFQQFRPGRIDHHNVQITLALLAVAATMWSDRVPWAAFAAGAFTGWSLAIGLEALPIHALCGVALALRYVVEPNAAGTLRRYGLALAVSTMLAFLVSVGPDHWTRSLCDSLAVNLAAAVTVAGLGVCVVGWPRTGVWSRLAVMAGVGATAAAVFAAFEPQCLRGPYAQMDPAVWPFWLSQVRETQSIWTLALKAPQATLQVMAFPILALAAVLITAFRDRLWRDFGFCLAAGVFLISFVTMLETVRAYSYVVWLGLPLVAVAAMRIFARLRLNSLAIRVFAVILVAPTVVTGGAAWVASAMGTPSQSEMSTVADQACVNRANIAPLAALPPAFIVTNEPDWGPFVLVWTPHRLLAGPYHRLTESILTTQRIFASTPDTARTILSRIRADYLVVCGTRAPFGVTAEALEASLWTRLQSGPVPDWLEPVKLDAGPFTVYRVMH